jgi:ABC-type sugar transport system substrate-binding protein
MKQRMSRNIVLFALLMILAATGVVSPASPVKGESVAPAVGPTPTLLPTLQFTPEPSNEEPSFTLPSAKGYILGYEAGENQNIDGLLKACAETKMECVRGKDIDELVKKGVDVILSYSNEWHVSGVWPQIQNAKAASIPIFMLNADSGEHPGIYNLSTLYSSTRSSLEWIMAQMGGEGEFVYFNFGANNYIQEIIDEVLAANPNVKATSMPASYDKESITKESITEMVKANPKIKAIWSNNKQMDIFWALANLKDIEQLPVFLCSAREDDLKSWKKWLEADPNFKCFATIQPGSTDYEGVYAALFYLNGEPFNSKALGGKWGNTLSYDYPIITSDKLDEWMGKVDSLEKGDFGVYRLPAMTPGEIHTRWFKK